MQDEGTKLFIEKSRKVHGDKYDYSQSIYTGNKNKIKIICREHGEFFQCPQDHYGMKGCGCRKCGGKFCHISPLSLSCGGMPHP